MGLGNASELYFKGRIIDRTGNIGPWSDWVYGSSSSDSDEILSYLDGKISDTQLDVFLKGEISKIDVLGQQIADFEAIKDYDTSKEYVKGNMVKLNGAIYAALETIPTNSPPPSILWEKLGDYDSLNGLLSATVLNVKKNTADITQTASGVAANSESISLINASLNDPDTGLNAQASALQSLATRVEDTEAGVTANSEMTTALSASLRGSRADGEKADALEGWYAQAAYSESVTVQTTETEALAERSEKLEVSIGNNSAAVETVSRVQADTSGKLSSMWGVRMRQGADGKWVTAGIGLGIENVDGVYQSQFIVDANLFAVRNGVNGNQETVFAVQGGQTILRSALIGDATITNAKIANAAITSAKIGSAAITTGKIADLSVDTLQLAGRAVTIPVISSTAGEIMWNTTPRAWKEIQRVTVNSTGQVAVITASSEFYTNFDPVWFKARIRRGGTVLWESKPIVGFHSDQFWSELLTISVADTPPAGSNTYVIEVLRDRELFDQGRAANRTLVYMELKR